MPPRGSGKKPVNFFAGKKTNQPDSATSNYGANPVLQITCFYFYPVMYLICSEKLNARNVLKAFGFFYLGYFFVKFSKYGFVSYFVNVPAKGRLYNDSHCL